MFWGDKEVGTAISCTECSLAAGFIQKFGRSSSKAPCLHAAVLHLKIAVIIIIRSHVDMQIRGLMHVHTEKELYYGHSPIEHTQVNSFPRTYHLHYS